MKLILKNSSIDFQKAVPIAANTEFITESTKWARGYYILLSGEDTPRWMPSSEKYPNLTFFVPVKAGITYKFKSSGNGKNPTACNVLMDVNKNILQAWYLNGAFVYDNYTEFTPSVNGYIGMFFAATSYENVQFNENGAIFTDTNTKTHVGSIVNTEECPAYADWGTELP